MYRQSLVWVLVVSLSRTPEGLCRRFLKQQADFRNVNIRRRGGASRAKCKAGAAMPFGEAADECFRHDRSQRQRSI
jgi:hypothetical protein